MHSSTLRFILARMGFIVQLLALPTMIHAQMLRVGDEVNRLTSTQPDEEEELVVDSTCIRLSDRFGHLWEVQKMLKKEEALLEYFVTDTVVFILSITHSTLSWFQQEIYPSFRESLQVFRRKLTSADLNGLTSLGHQLYTILIAPLKDFLKDKTRLIVIPGQELAGVPFEAFVSESAAEGEQACGSSHYLIFDYEIIYNYSPEIWIRAGYLPGLKSLNHNVKREHLEATDRNSYAFTGISPVFDDHPTLAALPGSLDEVKEIGSMFEEMGLEVCVLSNQNSGELQVKEVAGNSRILHLATHNHVPRANKMHSGFALWGLNRGNNSDSLEDGLLTGKEIRELRLDADLIVLNACSSGVGHSNNKIPTAPQPLNFLKAGARNIISSLWDINDYLASRFMVGFYRNCFEGLTYSAALRKTKLEMLCNPETSLPTLWAQYIIVGH